MPEIIVTVNDRSLLPMLEKAIGLLWGVVKVSVRTDETKKRESRMDELPEDIRHLVGIASGISRKHIESDERLKYLMEK